MKDFYPLTHPQSRIWHVERSHPGTSMWNNAGTLKIRGSLDFGLLDQAIQTFIEQNDSVRLRIALVDEEPVQYIASYRPVHIEELDFTESGVSGLYEWDTRQTQAPMPLVDSPLYYFALAKTASDEGYVYAKMHHIISDGVSFVVFANEIMENYENLLSKVPVHAASKDSYLGYVKEEREYIDSPRYRYDESYWLKRFDSLPEPTVVKQKKADYFSTRARRKACVVPSAFSDAIRAFCDRNRISIFSLLLASFSVYLNRTIGKDDVVVGAPVSNRTFAGSANRFGMYVSTVPIRIHVDNGQRFKDFAEDISNEWFSTLKHQKYPYDSLIRKLRETGRPADLLYDISLSYQIGTFKKTYQHFSYEGRWHFSGYQATSLSVHLNDREGSGRFILDYDYQTPLFSAREIDFVHEHLMNILADAIAHPDKRLYELAMLSPEEYRKVTVDFNESDDTFPRGSLLSIWDKRVREDPESTALVYHDRGMGVRELDERSTHLAHHLASKGVRRGEIVALMLPRSDSYFMAMLAILKVGAAFLPIDTVLPKERVAYMVDESAIRFAVCDGGVALPEGLTVISCDASEEDRGPLPEIEPEWLAYVIYTSGSTGKPKGVMIEHHSIAHFAYAMQRIWGRTTKGRMLCAGSPSFDLSIMEAVIGLLCGHTLVIADNQEASFPEDLCALISRQGIDMMMVTPGRIELLLASTNGRTALRGFREIGLGADVLTPVLLSRVHEASNAHVTNFYGPTETTIVATCSDVTEASEANIGRPIRGARAYILDPYLNPVAISVPGELYIGGKGIGRGYVGRDELTAQRFVPSPFSRGERLYRSGDLCRWYPRGEIQFLGRIDQQVKIRGYRVELGEIENSLLQIEGVRSCAVVCREDSNGRKYLCAYLVGESYPSVPDLKSRLAKVLPFYMVPSQILSIPELPLTPSGKLDWRALPDPQDLPDVPCDATSLPVTQTEERLLGIWSDLLGTSHIGRGDHFFDIGGDSLLIVRMVTEVADAFDVNLDLEDIYKEPTLSNCAALIDVAEQRFQKPIRPLPSRRYYPATPTQQRMYLVTRQAPESTAYNVPSVYLFPHAIDEKRFTAALQALIERHSILRTSLHLQGNRIVQRVHRSFELPYRCVECEEKHLKRTVGDLIRPFDIETSPLVRAALVRTPKRDALFLDFHHAVCDQASMAILLGDLEALYGGDDLPPLDVDYKDCAAWIDEYLSSDAIEGQREFWRAELSGDVPLLDLPLDKPRRALTEGAAREGRISARQLGCARGFAHAERATIFSTMMTAFSIVLAKETGQEKIVVGTPVSGRTQPAMQHTAGAFINTLPICCYPEGRRSVRDYFLSVNQTLIRALAHQDYPFERMVTDMSVSRDSTRNPLFDAMLVMGRDELGLSLGTEHAHAERVQTKTSKLDLTLYLYEGADGLTCHLEYRKDLFSATTAQRMLDRFTHTVETVFEQPDTLLRDVCVLPPEEHALVTQRFSATEDHYEQRYLNEWIEGLARERPHDIAVVAGEERITFEELNDRANRIAHELMEHGARRGVVVALMMHRTIDLMPALFGIMKTGAAYLPIDPSYPAQRVAFMLGDSGVGILLGDDGAFEFSGRSLSVAECLAGTRHDNPTVVHSADDVAYLIYTSGSTGLPKGSMLQKRGMANLMHAAGDCIAYDPKQVGVSITTMSFDIFVTDAILPVCHGCCVVMASEEESRQPHLLAQAIEREDIAYLQATPSRMHIMMQSKDFVRAANGHLRKIVLAGEKPPLSLVRRIKQAIPAEIKNGYGPTETTVYASFQDMTHTDHVSIGTPISNTHIYLLDANRRPVPIGTPAEAYISGDGVSPGYVGREDLNETCFMDDPFRPGNRMYKSGDICRFTHSGEILILGRADHQLKIRGLRIEPGEIESCLLRCTGIRDAVVVALGGGEQRHLCAYYTSENVQDERHLRQELARELPTYMVPSYLVRLDEIPMTVNGKVDRTMLPEPRIREHPVPDATQKVGPGQRKLLRAIARVLGLKQVSLQDNFFELGGDSLGVISVQAHMLRYGQSFRTQDFYDARTIGDLRPVEATARQEPALLSTPVRTRRNETAAQTGILRPADISCVLVTGATGFFGAHVVRELRAAGAHDVRCLVRAPSEEEAQARLDDALTFYFGTDHPLARAVCGDITQDASHLAGRLKDVTTLVHCAAWTDHVGDRGEYERINVGGARHMTELATLLNAGFVHISTTSISGLGLDAFDETCYDARQDVLHNEYARSKFLAEGIVLDAAREGLDARIFRLGNLTGRADDGVFQRSVRKNAFAMRLSAFMALGCYPEDRRLTIDLTPVDSCAQALMTLLLTPMTSNRIFHLVNERPLDMSELAFLLGECGHVLDPVSSGVFARSVANRSRDDFSHLFGVVRDVAENPKASQSAVSSQLTNGLLRQEGFVWPDITSHYLGKYLASIVDNTGE